jgi:hypothetical protein
MAVQRCPLCVGMCVFVIMSICMKGQDGVQNRGILGMTMHLLSYYCPFVNMS